VYGALELVTVLRRPRNYRDIIIKSSDVPSVQFTPIVICCNISVGCPVCTVVRQRSGRGPGVVPQVPGVAKREGPDAGVGPVLPRLPADHQAAASGRFSQNVDDQSNSSNVGIIR